MEEDGWRRTIIAIDTYLEKEIASRRSMRVVLLVSWKNLCIAIEWHDARRVAWS